MSGSSEDNSVDSSLLHLLVKNERKKTKFMEENGRTSVGRKSSSKSEFVSDPDLLNLFIKHEKKKTEYLSPTQVEEESSHLEKSESQHSGKELSVAEDMIDSSSSEEVAILRPITQPTPATVFLNILLGVGTIGFAHIIYCIGCLISWGTFQNWVSRDPIIWFLDKHNAKLAERDDAYVSLLSNEVM